MAFTPAFFRRLSELRRRLRQTRRNGKAEVGAVHAVHGGLDGLVIQQIANCNLGSLRSKRLGTRILAMNESANVLTCRKQRANGFAARRARRACHQNHKTFHRFVPFFAEAISIKSISIITLIL